MMASSGVAMAQEGSAFASVTETNDEYQQRMEEVAAKNIVLGTSLAERYKDIPVNHPKTLEEACEQSAHNPKSIISVGMLGVSARVGGTPCSDLQKVHALAPEMKKATVNATPINPDRLNNTNMCPMPNAIAVGTVLFQATTNPKVCPMPQQQP